MRVIARLDIKNNFVIKGINLEGLRKVGSPLEMIKNYYNDGIDEIIISGFSIFIIFLNLGIELKLLFLCS